MIRGEIQPDDLGPGTQNIDRIEGIRAVLHDRFNDAIPFLLLPVRLETRFMKVDRVVRNEITAADFIARLEDLVDFLKQLAQMEVKVSREQRPREKWRKGEKRLFKKVEENLNELKILVRDIELLLNVSFEATDEEILRLRELVNLFDEVVERGHTHLNEIQSAYQKDRFQNLFGVLRNDIKSLEHRIIGETIPKLELRKSLRFVPATVIHERIVKIIGVVKSIKEGDLADYSELEAARDKLYPLLRDLRQAVHAIIKGTAEVIGLIHAAWRELDKELEALTQLVREVPTVDRWQQAGVTRTCTHINDEYRKDLAPLFGEPSSRFQLLTNALFTASANSFTKVMGLLEELKDRTSMRLPARSRRMAVALSLSRAVVSTAKQVETLSRDICILPEHKYKELTKLYSEIKVSIDTLIALVERLGRLAGAQAAIARTLTDQLKAALATLAKATSGQRADVWDAYDVYYDEVRRTVFATHDTQTRTVDELWIRIYPDDIAIHTHEKLLTENELESGKIFWVETIAAGGDRDLQLAAWRVLCTHHGPRRAAWIAKVCDPNVSHDENVMRAFLSSLTVLHKRLQEAASQPKALVKRPRERGERLVRAVNIALDHAQNVQQGSKVQLEKAHALILVIRRKAEHLAIRYSRRMRAGARGSTWLKEFFLKLDAIEKHLGTLEAIDSINPNDEFRRELEFPDVETKNGPWTMAPYTPVMPERFVIITVSNEQVKHVIAGEAIPEKLTVGIDPDPEHASEEIFELDEDGNLIVGESIQWMVDFNAAVKKGMAVTVPLTVDEAKTGFDQVFALGVKGTDIDQSRKLLEELLENHHFAQRGLGLYPIGTATNNTEDASAGWKSREDYDESYRNEREGPLFEWKDESRMATDGQRLAEALGIDPVVLQNVVYANRRDISDSIIVNESLCPATVIGYFEEFFETLLSHDSVQRIREYFVEGVSARGLVPSIRVGRQPYGIFPTSAFSKWSPSTGDEFPIGRPEDLSVDDKKTRFDILLRDILAVIKEDWIRLQKQHVKHAHSKGVVDVQQHFLDMLGCHATSAVNDYRFALNVAQRYRGTDDGVSFAGYFGYGPMAKTGPSALLVQFEEIISKAIGVISGEPFERGRVRENLEEFYKELSGAHVYRVRYLKSLRPLTGPLVGNKYTEWVPTLLAVAPLTLVNESRFGEEHGVPLIQLLLRQALLFEYRNTALNILQTEGMLNDEARMRAGSGGHFLVRTLLADYFVTKWSYLFRPLSELNGRFEINFPEHANSLFSYLKNAAGGEKMMSNYLANRGENSLRSSFPGGERHAPMIQALQFHAEQVGRLTNISQDSLERLLQEHIDLCSYRFDAWQSAPANLRLFEFRKKVRNQLLADNRAPYTGIYLGAYGWLDDLRQGGARVPAENLSTSLTAGDGKPVYTDEDNQGFIHTPNSNLAVTAAILRSGYISEVNKPDIENRMAINLSSRRVRLALNLLDGIRAGHELGELLGCQLEKFLHEAYLTEHVSFDDLIYRLRRAFPSFLAVDQANSRIDQAERLVVDGLALLETVNDWVEMNVEDDAMADRTLYDILYENGRYIGYPWGITGESDEPVLPQIDDPIDVLRLPGLLKGIDQMADALDALGDLAVAESVYQIVRGNHVRASSVMAALAEGRAMQHPQLVEPPRTGTVVSHRLFLAFPPINGANLSSLEIDDPEVLTENRRTAAPIAWKDIPMTPRALAEPSLNRWLGEVLGPPENIQCVAIISTESLVEVKDVSIANLEFQPIDVLALFGAGFPEAESELAARILQTLLPEDIDPQDLPGAKAKVELRFTDTSSQDAKSFVEIATLLTPLQGILGKARYATANEFELDETVQTTNDEQAATDSGELQIRVETALAGLTELGLRLVDAIDPNHSSNAIELPTKPEKFLCDHEDTFSNAVEVFTRRKEFAALLRHASDYGIVGVSPPGRYEDLKKIAQSFEIKIKRAILEIIRRITKATKLLGEISSEDESKTAVLVKSAQIVFGKSFTIFPLFTLQKRDEIRDGLASNHLLRHAGDLAVESWLHSVSSVRDKVANLQQVIVLADAMGCEVPAARPIQLSQSEEDYWLGAEFPDDYHPTDDKLSLVIFGYNHLDIENGHSVALVVDEWLEIIPSRIETTGVAFHYDQPDAVPPQSLLLAVPPKESGRWNWDDLVHTIYDTLELVKLRMVEPEHLQDTIYAQLLPAIIGELVPERITRLDEQEEIPGSRVILDFEVNNSREQ